MPAYSPGESFFTVFGVFFPAATGVMAGFNMSSDLQRPEHNIPVGTLTAVFTSWFLYLVFVFLLGAICTREALRYDFLIAEKVSLVGFLFLLGLYVSSLASCMGGLYGAPRILQCIAQERVFPSLAFLGTGKGPNRTPVAAICLTSLLTMAFVFIGQVNVLAPIVTINFLLTYVFIDYSYFSVAMTFQLQTKEKQENLVWTKRQQRRWSTRQSSRALIQTSPPNYGTGDESTHCKGTLLEFSRDMDHIFPPVDSEAERSSSVQDTNSKNRSKTRQTSVKQNLMDSFGLNNFVSSEGKDDLSSATLHEDDEVECESGQVKATNQLQNLTEIDHHEQDSLRNNKTGNENKPEHQSVEIQPMADSVYTKFCNHWISLIGAASSILIMFVIQWVYAVVNIVVAVLLYFYIGKTSPGLPTGIAAQFSFFTWLKSTLSRIYRGKKSSKDEIVVTPSLCGVGLKTKQLTEENADFASRHRFHQSSFIGAEEMVQVPFH